MLLDADRLYEALKTHDRRFDGLFFVGVRTTGIYCRPVCPARTPHRENCEFFRVAALAERAGFRPCLRCRPELAPGAAPVDSVGRLAQSAAQRIEDGALDDAGLEELAAELGVSSRHLRRAVQQELGVSPVELAQTRRLLLARQLLADSSLSVTEVAFASGFSSVRRFNSLYQERYRTRPSDSRRSRPNTAADTLHLRLGFRPPLAWEPLLHFLSARLYAGVEAIAGQRYLRTVEIGGHRGWAAVEPDPEADRGRPVLHVELSTSLVPVLAAVLTRVKHLFDLSASPDRISEHFAADPWLAEAMLRTPGLRVPGSWDPFELVLRAVLGQQVSVRAATTIAGRFSEAFGEPIDTPHAGLTRLVPTAERVAAATVDELARLGIPGSRATCISAVARAFTEGTVRLAPGMPADRVLPSLLSLPGIGEWTAQYVAMRALRWPDAMPHADLGLRKALEGRKPGEILALSERWRPWRAYATMYLWQQLETQG